jgi:hypothetical protein
MVNDFRGEVSSCQPHSPPPTTSTHLAALEQRVQDAEAGWRREAEARKAAEQRADAAERKLVRIAPATDAIHAALRPMESPLSHADWNLTVLNLVFGHNRYDSSIPALAAAWH